MFWGSMVERRVSFPSCTLRPSLLVGLGVRLESEDMTACFCTNVKGWTLYYPPIPLPTGYCLPGGGHSCG